MKYFILLPSVSDVGTPYDDIQWGAVLKSVSAFEMYRKRYGRISPDRVVESCYSMGNSRARCDTAWDWPTIRCIRFTGIRLGAFSCSAEQRLGLLRSELDYAHVDPILQAGLHEFFDNLQFKMNAVDECIREDFFAHKAVLRASSSGQVA